MLERKGRLFRGFMKIAFDLEAPTNGSTEAVQRENELLERAEDDVIYWNRIPDTETAMGLLRRGVSVRVFLNVDFPNADVEIGKLPPGVEGLITEKELIGMPATMIDRRDVIMEDKEDLLIWEPARLIAGKIHRRAAKVAIQA